MSNTEQIVSDNQREWLKTMADAIQHADGKPMPVDPVVADLLRTLISQPSTQHQGEPVEAIPPKDCVPGWHSDYNDGLFATTDAVVTLYLHPPTSDGFSAGDMADQGAKAFRDGVKTSADLIQKRMDDYLNEFGALDPETGSVELPHGGDEYVGELSEIIEAVRSLPLP